MDECTRQAYLAAMGIDAWVLRDADPASDQPSAAGGTDFPAASADAERPGEDLGWEQLRGRVSACTRCELHRTRTQAVFGVGSPCADLLIIGEAPGAEEDRRGEPFVGRAGQLLNAMLAAVGFAREQVFIANILKCRPPKNRDPRPEEAANCSEYLNRQIEFIAPKVILALGRVAAQNLLHTDTPIGRMRGRQYRYADTDIPVVVTYHPAYLLRSPREKRKAWQDLNIMLKLLAESS